MISFRQKVTLKEIEATYKSIGHEDSNTIRVPSRLRFGGNVGVAGALIQFVAYWSRNIAQTRIRLYGDDLANEPHGIAALYFATQISDAKDKPANLHPIISRYQDIALLILRNTQEVRFRLAHKKLLERAIDLRLCERKLSHTGHYSYIESDIERYLYSNIPRAWMAEHFSEEFLDKTFSPSPRGSTEYQTGLRRVHTVINPVFFLLALAALFESTVEISSILFEPQTGLNLRESQMKPIDQQ